VSSKHQQDEERKNKVQVQDHPSQKNHMLEACHLYDVHEYVKICLSRDSFTVQYVEKFARPQQDLNKQVQSRKTFHLEVDKIIIIKLKCNLHKAN
jgi:aromatic ring hydroxylase